MIKVEKLNVARSEVTSGLLKKSKKFFRFEGGGLIQMFSEKSAIAAFGKEIVKQVTEEGVEISEKEVAPKKEKAPKKKKKAEKQEEKVEEKSEEKTEE